MFAGKLEDFHLFEIPSTKRDVFSFSTPELSLPGCLFAQRVAPGLYFKFQIFILWCLFRAGNRTVIAGNATIDIQSRFPGR